MKGCLLPAGNRAEFPKLDAELTRRGITAIVTDLSTGGRVYQIPDEQTQLLPTDERGAYLGDSDSGHSIYEIEICFYEEIGHVIGGVQKIYETACDDEVTVEKLPTFCSHCSHVVHLVPACRRCGSVDHTTGWHDADDARTGKPAAVPLNVTSAAQLHSLIKKGAKP